MKAGNPFRSAAHLQLRRNGALKEALRHVSPGLILRPAK
jgi:hypothetical protein